MQRSLIGDDDLVLVFPATQEARHAAMLRANEVARGLVERTRANAAGQADDDGELPEPAPLRIVIGFAREDISTKQRGFLHAAVLPQIADQVTMPDGTRYTAAVWKEHFRLRFLPDVWELRAVPRYDPKLCRLVQPKRKTPHRVRVSTETLTVKQYSEFIDAVIDTATLELGVVFEFWPPEREAVRYRPPARKRKERQPEDQPA